MIIRGRRSRRPLSFETEQILCSQAAPRFGRVTPAERSLEFGTTLEARRPPDGELDQAPPPVRPRLEAVEPVDLTVMPVLDAGTVEHPAELTAGLVQLRHRSPAQWFNPDPAIQSNAVLNRPVAVSPWASAVSSR